ncbi:MAG: hypothetical protein ACYDA1_02465, partial [Vulcanimicrobiaceae bacterium]
MLTGAPTINPSLLPGDVPPSPGPVQTRDPNSPEAQQAIAGGMAVQPVFSGCLQTTPANGSLLERLWAAAHHAIGTRTGNLLGGGTNSCAAIESIIVSSVAGHTVGDPSVDDWRALALSQGGTILGPGTSSLAERGAIIIWPQT